ncbi:hypothetical protein HN51_060324 [Arachis hypogaea]|uniref:Uncharacterized protein n=1 Tax=Arachis hypogaea TaxID=3818 RepID=A0A444X9A6_ARAHY|nr:uncharacterized protein LOC107621688 [Arachis ipaensis]XP_020969427.1 uncharacterized protein LOC107621688 [Arachis ipaensis]XP_025684955.1 uncharacterized protein LOC112785735 [Arachis hypogaea]XP_025684956.1 uncharacterized protein LOC112785735 [Arachis hypogaea]QHN83943.1 UPF0481 protein [Arachis hypogaea]QHN83944.1 UPF0481 protein [Arachis hypogaea]QHN83945.1 UPF0481 protein [Arachis hypogaea]RYQ86268.1 hypothetical protein Ahy_B10g105948 [Arachis hypogaea]
MAEILHTPVDERLTQLLHQTFEVHNQISSSKTKIQRVPTFLRQNPDFAKYCIPKMISFGPIHYQNDDLKQGQQFKLQWTSLYIDEYGEETNGSTNKEAAAKLLYKIIQDNIGRLKLLFSVDVIECYVDKELIWMLFVDGCSLLYYMDKVEDHRPEKLRLKLDQLMYTYRDIMLLENQLPMELLELLSKKKGADLGFLMHNFLSGGNAKQLGMYAIKLKQNPTHILDYYRSNFVDAENGKYVMKQDDNKVDDEDIQVSPPPEDLDAPPVDRDASRFWERYKNIRDLKSAGIRVKPNKSNVLKWDNISFTSKWFGGELRLPMFLFNDNSPYYFRNMIAYEMCPDFNNNFGCSSFFSFMDSLIDDAEDVKELRLAGVFQNLLGSDEELAKFFNELGHDLPTKLFHYIRTDAVAYSKKYIQVKFQIQKHYRKRWNKWLAEARSTYFNTPWSLLAFLAALLALVLTFIQAWYAIHPK